MDHSMGADGASLGADTFICYPQSDSLAVVCTGTDERSISAYGKDGKVLVVFNSKGEGCVSYKSGRPWLVVTMNGWHVSDPDGNMLERGRFPRSGKEFRCEPTPNISVTFTDRQHITLAFSCDQIQGVWSCGEQLKRTDSHLHKIVSRSQGKLTLDVSAIRARQASVGSVYGVKGPHASRTVQPGLGVLRRALQAIKPGSQLHGTVQELKASDARLKLIDVLPTAQYGTTRPSSRSKQVTEVTSMAEQRMGKTVDQQHKTVTSPLLPDYGKPPMSDQQKKLQRVAELRHKRADFIPRRQRLNAASMQVVEKQVTCREAKKDTLYCLCVMADWQPGCARLRPQLEMVQGELTAHAAAAPNCPAAHIQMFEVDASESRALQDRLKFRSVPMFLFYYEGRLIQATNAVSNDGELMAACLNSLERGRKGQALPENFQFAGDDNALLDCITPTMLSAKS